MRFRKFALGILITIFIFNFYSSIDASAAEGTTESQENKTEGTSIASEETEETSADSEVPEETLTDSEVPEEISTDSEVPEETSADSGKAEEASVDSEVPEEISTDSEVPEETSADSGKAEEDEKADETKETVKDTADKYTKAELRLLSALVYCEAQGESYNGKLAVAIVVMNRKRSNRYPDTLKGVIYQKYQFGPAFNGTLKKALEEYDKGNFTSSAEKACIKAAKAALSGVTSLTVKGKEKDFSKYLSFSGRLKGYTYKLGNHQFK